MYLSLYILCSFIENLFALKYCTRLKYTNSNENKEQNTEEDNSIKELMQTPVINREDYYIKELMNTSVFTKEKLLDSKNDVITTFEVISMEPTNGLYN